MELPCNLYSHTQMLSILFINPIISFNSITYLCILKIIFIFIIIKGSPRSTIKVNKINLFLLFYYISLKNKIIMLFEILLCLFIMIDIFIRILSEKMVLFLLFNYSSIELFLFSMKVKFNFSY